MSNDLSRIYQLMTLATGDEKHSPSAHSTLDILWVLYDRVLRYDAQHPRSEERDRFVLSKGHGPLAYYAILVDKGFFPASELSKFLQWDGMLGGHPDRNQVPGVETSTGSLGHGLAMATGMAVGLRAKQSKRRVFALLGDAECNEGSVWEAALLAGNRQLPHLTCIVVNNHSGSQPMGDIASKFAAFGWATTNIDGRDHQQIYQALQQHDAQRPTVVVAEIHS
jgi:transketolase